MAQNLVINGVSYLCPQQGDQNWAGANQADGWMGAVTVGMLQKAGGAFTLTADVNFGPSFGLLSAYFKSISNNIAGTGQLRLANADSIAFRNSGNSADLLLQPGSDGILNYNGVALLRSGFVVNSDLASAAGIVYSKLNLTASVVNSDISASAAIAYSKLNLSGAITNSDISSSAAIAYSKLSLTGSVVNADIATSAAIARSKIAAGTASQVIVNDGSGNLSSVAQLAIANGGTGQTTASAAFDSLSPTTTKGDLIVRSSSTNTRLPIGSDGQVPVADSTQANGLAWKTLQQGAKNYITYNSFENNSTTGWSLAHSAVTSSAPTSTATAGTAFDSTHGGTAANAALSFTTTATGKLAGAFSGSLASSAATTVGDLLISQAYTIDIEDQARMLAFKFFYQLTAGTANFSGTSSNSWAVWIYDVTNGAWIQPAGVYNLVQGTGVGIASGTFQTPSNMTQFQIALVNLNTTSGAVTLLLDDFSVGPQAMVNGPAMTDWQTSSATVSNLPVSSTVAVQKRSGDSLELVIYGAASGAATGTITINLPTGLSIDTTKIDSSGALDVGISTGQIGGTNYTGHAQVVSATTIRFYSHATTSVWNASSPGTWASGSVFSASIKVPIVGWSSNSAMSSDTDTRVCAMRANKNSGSHTTSGSYQTVGSWTVDSDTHGAFNALTGAYTVQVSGFHRILGCIALLSNATGVRAVKVQKNGTDMFYGNSQVGSSSIDADMSFSGGFWANAGDTIQVLAIQTSGGTLGYATNSNQSVLYIARETGPAVVAATETVAARYRCTTADTVSGTNTVNYETKDIDDHSAVTVNASSWRFTAPVSGTYRVTAGQLAATTTANTIFVYKNGSLDLNLGAAAAANVNFSGTGITKLLAGDYVDIRNGSGTTLTLSADNYANYICIERIGN